MTNNHNITHEAFIQSQVFKNILSAGAKIASFLQQVEINNNKQAKAAANLIKNWDAACEQLANYNEKERQVIRHTEIVDDVTEYLGKAKAMLDMVLNARLDEISAKTLHNYLWELLSLLDTVESVFEVLR